MKIYSAVLQNIFKAFIKLAIKKTLQDVFFNSVVDALFLTMLGFIFLLPIKYPVIPP